jgi:hypothetical protein
LGYQRNDGKSNCNSGDGTGQMAQPWMFMMMMMMVGKLREAHPKTNLAYYDYSKTLRFTKSLSLSLSLSLNTDKAAFPIF